MKVVITTPMPEQTKERFKTIPDIDLQFTDRANPETDKIENAEVILGNIPVNRIPECKKLKWLQLDSAGANTIASLPQQFILTNASGAYGEAISEHMLACTLSSLKNLMEYHELQESHDWVNLGSVKTISQCKVLCIGTGNIGTEYAKRMHMLGAVVDGMHRTKDALPEVYSGNYTLHDIDEIIGNYDIVAMSLPETKDTIHVLKETELRNMKQGSILINVGRGSAIDEVALVKVAKEGHFKSVYLDVMEIEPLPKNNPLWKTKSIYVTPHISGRFNAQATFDHVIDIFYTNLNHYLNDEPLEHIVDRTLGY